jgi:hypothetical protein
MNQKLMWNAVIKYAKLNDDACPSAGKLKRRQVAGNYPPNGE